MCHIPGGRGLKANRRKIVQTRCSPPLFTDCHPDTVAHSTENTVCVCVCVCVHVGSGALERAWIMSRFASAQGLQDVGSSVFNRILLVLPARSNQHRLNVTFIYTDTDIQLQPGHQSIQSMGRITNRYKTRTRVSVDIKHEPKHQSIKKHAPDHKSI
jgi:hypothetical protein